MNALALSNRDHTPSPFTFAYVPPSLVRDYVKGDLVFHCGDRVTGLQTVASGLVRLTYLTEQGREITVRLAGPGNILEPNFLTPDAHHTVDAVCVTPNVALTYTPRAAFSREVPLDLFRQVAQQLSCAEMRVAFSTYPAETRGAWLLDWLVARFGVPHPGGWAELALALTHEDVAVMVNVTRVTVTCVFKQLRSEGCLLGSRGRYLVRMSLLARDLAPGLTHPAGCGVS